MHFFLAAIILTPEHRIPAILIKIDLMKRNYSVFDGLYNINMAKNEQKSSLKLVALWAVVAQLQIFLKNYVLDVTEI